MDRDYGAAYRELYRRHWWWREREAAILEELRRICPAAGWHRVLDVGCGDGLFFDRLREFGAVEGVEPEAALLDPEGPWRSVIHPVPFDERFRPPHQFGLILMLDVLEHLAEPEAALRHALRLLAPGGSVVITVPAFQSLWTRHDDLNHHFRRYTRATFRRLAGAAGLRITRERYLFQWLVLGKLAVRALEALHPGPPRPPAIPPRPLNALLGAVTRAERAVGSLVPMPLGSSLLITGSAEAPAPRR